MPSRILPVTFLSLALFLSVPEASYSQEASADLTSLNLEDLMNMEVVTASKRPERFFSTSAAVYVITSEDIERSGSRTIPELLRMVPGLSVQQVNAHTWDISARGFNGSIFANKLLVMIDGRAVYSPLLGGVFWELQDTLLEDIDRIEVIRGPGGALWGANAVNGVINVITKRPSETKGGYLRIAGGTEERVATSLRYGSHAKAWDYRVYAKYFNRDEGYRSTRTANDEWQMARTGFRAERDDLTVQGDFYQGYLGQTVTLSSFSAPYTTSSQKASYAQGGNILLRYAQDDWSLQTYWQATHQDFQTLKERRDIIDVEYNRRHILGASQEVTWGGGYRLNVEDISSTESLSIGDTGRPDALFSLFLQDEIRFMDDRLKLTLGSKLEHNIYTAFEAEPSVRLAYDINDTNVVWTAASRAIRTPSRFEASGNSLSAAAAPASFSRLMGSDDLDSEKMRSYEVGYRTQPRDNLYVDISAFADHYDHVVTYTPGPSTMERGYPVTNYVAANGLEGEIYGVEMAGDVRITPWWKIKNAYTYTKMNIMTGAGTSDVGIEDFLENAVPRHSFYSRSALDLPHTFQFGATLRYTDAFAHGQIPGNTQMDVMLSKTFNGWTVSVVGENLFRKHHKESYAGLSSATTQIERSVYAKAVRNF